VTKDFTLEEVENVITLSPSHKAPGPSGIPNECWKKVGKKMKERIVNLFNKIQSTEKMPKEWRRANIIPIAKPKNWEKDITNTRPITLLETLRKIFTKIYTDRIEEACRRYNILKGNNCSVLKGTSTHGPIVTLRQILEQTNEEKGKQTWIVLQDMKKAYDSVSWEGLEAVLNRINMNKKFVRLMNHLHNNRKSAIITAHGLTEEYTIQNGLD